MYIIHTCKQINVQCVKLIQHSPNRRCSLHYILFLDFPAMLDYIPIMPSYLMFSGNMTTSELRILLINDDTAELDEQFTVNLVEITPNVVVSMNNATVTIIDDDGEYRY